MEKFKKGDVALSTFNFLFSELISFMWKKDEKNIRDNLKKVGADMGFRLYNLIAIWEGTNERENRILPMTRFVQTTVFKYLFGKGADKLSVYNHSNIEGKKVYVIRYSLIDSGITYQ
jgi:hypothetical protein